MDADSLIGEFLLAIVLPLCLTPCSELLGVAFGFFRIFLELV